MRIPLKALPFYLLVISALRLNRVLRPAGRPFVFAHTLGRLQRGRLREAILQKMRLVLGDDVPPEQLKRLWRAHVCHAGQMMLETYRLLHFNRQQLKDMVELDGEDNLRDALKGGRGAVLFLNHLGTFPLVPILLGRMGCDITVFGNTARMLNRLNSPEYAEIGLKAAIVGEHPAGLVAEILRRNGLIGAYFDHALSERRTDWFRFGPAEIRQHLGPAILALRHKAAALYLSSHRMAGNRHQVRISLLPGCDRNGTLRERAFQLTAQATAKFHRDLREHPEQWWMWDWGPIRASQTNEAFASLTPAGMAT